MAQQVQNLTALRGAACVIVVLTHVHTWDAAFGMETPVFREVRWVGAGSLDVFFALSGFIITATNRKYFGRPAAVPGYFLRRAWRIYPTYWAALAACALTGWALFDWRPFGPELVGGWPAWLALVPSAAVNPFIGQTWSMVFEVVYYCAFGVLLCLPARAAAAVLVAWGGVAAASLAAPAQTHPWLAAAVNPFLFEFLGGAAVAWLAGRGVRAWWRAALVLGVGYMAAAIAVVASWPEPYGLLMTEARVRVGVFGTPAVLLVYGLVAAEGEWPRRVPRWLCLVGEASYSIYLVHYQLILAAVLVGMKLPHSRGPHLLWLAGTIVVVMAGGLAFYALVEKPLLKLGRSRRRAAPPAAPPEAVSTRRAA